jgi:hypothetical protein
MRHGTTRAAKAMAALILGLVGRPSAPLIAQQTTGSDELRTRNLWNPAFNNQRPSSGLRPAAKKTPKEVAALGDSFVGVTLWKMRPSKPSDPARFRGLVHDQDPNGQAEWTPERSNLDAPIRGDDMVRLSIESARKGFLYVVDRDAYPDGTFSKPTLIFPTTRLRGGNNRVEPGFLIEIPDAQDHPAAFRVEKTRPDQTGVVLTILVAPEPIPGLALTADAVKLTEAQVAEWERRWGSNVQRLDEKDSGRVYTTAEADAARGRLAPLRAEDPVPSTLFHCQGNRAEPMLVKVQLKLSATTPR